MYYCGRCKAEYETYPENGKCKHCGSRIFYKKREPIKKTIKAN